jgi:ATP-dependent RNA helicase DeaD
MISFEELGIRADIVSALVELGFENPMPVQEKVIPLLLDKNTDIVCLAQTGTGKTAAFGLPLIQKIVLEDHHVQSLILCPTRELCVQIAGDLNDYAKNIDELKVLPVYGGSSMEVQLKALKKGVHIVVATPGRLVDLIDRKAIKLGQVSTVVLDEADEMLNMGFQESINAILSQVPEERNTLLFSATMPKEVAVIAKKYMNKPVEVTIGDKNSGAENIKHVYYTVHARDKYLALKRIVDFYPSVYGIVFCRTRRETQEVADKLIHDGYNAESLHGDLSQVQRDTVMQKFRIRHIRLLVATDVAARGIDVDDLTHIINFNLPDDLDSYTHRSGRTGRAGKAGTSIVLINMKERHLISQIEKKINKSFIHGKVPGGREICEKQLFAMIDKMEKVEMDQKEIDSYLPVIYRKLEWLDKEEIIKRFVALEFNRFLEYYSKAHDLNVPDDHRSSSSRDRDDDRGRERSSSRSERGDRGDRGDRFGKEKRKPAFFEQGGEERPKRKRVRDEDEAGYSRLTINAGKAAGMNPRALMDLVNEYTPGKQVPIGKIDLKPDYTVFDVANSSVKMVIETMQNADFEGLPVKVEYAKEGAASKERPTYKERSQDKERPRQERDERRKKPFAGSKRPKKW